MYEDRVLAFIDVLGFSAAIDKTIINGEENEAETKKINELLENIQGQINNKSYSSSDIYIKNRVVNHFSDSVIISYLKTDESNIFRILVDILFLCSGVLHNDFLLRGAVVCGKLYHEGTKIFGPAIVKAVKMEKEIAVYPRIILDDSILDILEKYPIKQKKQKDEFRIINKMIFKDFDGIFCIDLFDFTKINIANADLIIPSEFEPLRKKIEKMKLDKDNENINTKSKYLWLKEKYHSILKRYMKKYYNDKTKEKNPKLYEYIKKLIEEKDADTK